MSNEVIKVGVECANNTIDMIRRAVTSTCDLKEITDIEFVAMVRTLAGCILRSVDKISHLEHIQKVNELESDPYIVTLTVLIFEQLAKEQLCSEVNRED